MGILTRGQYTFGNKTKTQIVQLTTAQALTGTSSMSSGSATITGVGTLYTQEVFVGDVVRFNTSAYSFIIQSITSNTQMTATVVAPVAIASQVLSLPNPKRIKRGDSVFNVTDRFAMYYSGDNTGGLNAWVKGEFCNGQVVPIINSARTATITEGQVLQNSTTINAAIEAYSAGTIDPAIAVTYHLAFGDSCVPSAVCGIHNTDASGAIPKGNFVQPSLTAGTSALIDDNTTSTADSCGIALTASGTPVAGEFECYINFQERL